MSPWYIAKMGSLTGQLCCAPIGLPSPIRPANPDLSYCGRHDVRSPHRRDDDDGVNRHASCENAPCPYAQALIMYHVWRATTPHLYTRVVQLGVWNIQPLIRPVCEVH